MQSSLRENYNNIHYYPHVADVKTEAQNWFAQSCMTKEWKSKNFNSVQTPNQQLFPRNRYAGSAKQD